jgi:hypothetical protein
MKETPQQYTARILGNVGSRQPLAVQRATPAKLGRAIRGLSTRQLRKRPAPDKWSITEILAHLRDAEMVIGFRLRMAIAQSGSPLQAYDQDRWARHCNYAREGARVALREFGVLRACNHRLLKSIPKAAWGNYGMHAERGKETVAHLTRMVAGHDLNHLRQVQDLARRWRRR